MSGLVCWPLAAALALTTQRASLLAGVVGGFLILISSRQACLRPPGAPFFLLRRRKNRGRKTPLRAGGPSASVRPLAFAMQMPYLIERERGSKTAPFTLSLPGARLGCISYRRRTLYGVPGRFVRASVPCRLVSRPLAASLLLTLCRGDLGAFVFGAAFSVGCGRRCRLGTGVRLLGC